MIQKSFYVPADHVHKYVSEANKKIDELNQQGWKVLQMILVQTYNMTPVGLILLAEKVE